jgi:hypothetical protein
MYCCKVNDGQPVFCMGRTRAAGSVVEILVEGVSGAGAGFGHVVFGVLWSWGLETIARPMTLPIAPAIMAMSRPYITRKGHRIHFRRLVTVLSPVSRYATSFCVS